MTQASTQTIGSPAAEPKLTFRRKHEHAAYPQAVYVDRSRWIGDVHRAGGIWYATRPNGSPSPIPHRSRKAAGQALAREAGAS